MQMQVIVSACFSLYTFESNSGVAQPTATFTATSNLFNHNQDPIQPPLHQLYTPKTSYRTSISPPFHHQSNHISLNKRPYSPQTFTNHPTFAILFICPQTQNKKAKTRHFVSFSPFMLHKFTLTIAFSVCFPII